VECNAFIGSDVNGISNLFMKSFAGVIRWLSLIIVVLCSFQCKKEKQPLNITLYDKPLSVIQSYVNGKWDFQYAYGGITPIKYPAKHKSYMVLQNDRIILGNDSLGVVVDTTIIWKRDKDVFNDSTYLLTYTYTAGYAFPYAYVVSRIFNDTLELIDNASDPLYYYYVQSH